MNEKEMSKTQENIKKNKTTKIIAIIVVILILTYFAYVLYTLIKQPTDTFMVVEGKLYLEESQTGYIIRNEQIVKGENYKNGIVQIKAEGEKVAKGDTVFRYYSNGEEELKKKIEELDVKIQEALANETNVFSSDVKILEKQIEVKLNDIYQLNDIQKIKEYKKDINTAITKKAKIAGDLSPSGSYIRKLIDERSSYENKLNSGSEYITAPTSGVVSYRVDGLEESLNIQDFNTLNAKTLESLNLKTGQIVTSSNEAGKIIDNFECHIVAIMDSEKAKEAKVGDEVKIRLSSTKEIPATIDYIADEEEKAKMIVFKITNNVEELISYRKISFDVIWWSYSGLKVPNSAIIKDGDKNYVIRNRAGYLDKILVKVLRSNESYSIVGNYKTEELKDLGYTSEQIQAISNISLYDEILINPTEEMLKDK